MIAVKGVVYRAASPVASSSCDLSETYFFSMSTVMGESESTICIR